MSHKAMICQYEDKIWVQEPIFIFNLFHGNLPKDPTFIFIKPGTKSILTRLYPNHAKIVPELCFVLKGAMGRMACRIIKEKDQLGVPAIMGYLYDTVGIDNMIKHIFLELPIPVPLEYLTQVQYSYDSDGVFEINWSDEELYHIDNATKQWRVQGVYDDIRSGTESETYQASHGVVWPEFLYSQRKTRQPEVCWRGRFATYRNRNI